MSVITYNPKTAADAVGLSVDVIRAAINSGDLPARKPVIDGKTVERWLIDPQDLARWARGH